MTGAGPALALVADVGGTNVRFALCRPGARPERVVSLKCDRFASLEAAAATVLERLDARPREAAAAVAGPVEGGTVRMTNHPWVISAAAVEAALGLERCLLVNDFAATALSLPHLGPGDLRPCGGGEAAPDAAMAVLGPGTGLGVAGLVPARGGWVAVPGEGGHASFAPEDPFEEELLRELRRRRGHISREMVLSGPGLVRIYEAAAAVEGAAAPPLDPEGVSAAAAERPDGLAARAVRLFCRMLGATAGDVALTLGARGGVYLTGGVVAAFGPLFDAAAFRDGFEGKGRFRDYLAAIPTRVILHPYPALIGLSALLADGPGTTATRLR